MASVFAQRLAAMNDGLDVSGRRWVYVPYDQLTDQFGPVRETSPRELGIVLVESAAKARRRPYHKTKLAFILANQRHFALEQARRGVAVRYLMGEADYATQLAELDLRAPLVMMEAAERELRLELAPLIDSGRLEVVEHEGWLSEASDFEAAGPSDGPWRMDAFYRALRRRTGILMEGSKPAGGKFSFDASNRRAWRGDPPAPEIPRFEHDVITREVCELIESRFDEHPGDLAVELLAVTAKQAEAHWIWFLDEALEHFGPYQDAMSQASSSLFHARISGLMHLHRLSPRRVVDDVLARADRSIESREGFVRQVLGWREYVRHIHRVTDGFARVAQRNYFGAERALPMAYWGATSGMACLDRVVDSVWREGYGHHITRLMVLSNLATLLDVKPDAINEWFWVAYHDAFDWVVEPNVLGMGVHALGDLMTTKPYVCGGAYINRMGDYCRGCAFDPRKNCPVTSLYWAFIARHRERLAALGRMQRPLWSLEKRADEKQAHDAAVYRWVGETLEVGQTLDPRRLPVLRE